MNVQIFRGQAVSVVVSLSNVKQYLERQELSPTLTSKYHGIYTTQNSFYIPSIHSIEKTAYPNRVPPSPKSYFKTEIRLRQLFPSIITFMPTPRTL
jgi:hypothetical protein